MSTLHVQEIKNVEHALKETFTCTFFSMHVSGVFLPDSHFYTSCDHKNLCNGYGLLILCYTLVFLSRAKVFDWLVLIICNCFHFDNDNE